jgi:zona occludens toxin (predicted ATPase)
LAQLIATILVIRMWFENSLPRALRFEPIKPWMRLTLALWLITAILGIAIYVTWYIIKPWPATTPSGDVPAFTATEDATPDGAIGESTPEATADAASDATPAATEDVIATPAATEDVAASAATSEATPDQ